MAAQMSILLPSGLKSISVFRGQHLGSLRTFRTAKVMSGGTLRTVGTFSPLTASASPSPAVVYGYSASAVSLTTESVICSPTGGFGPFTYSWAKVSGDTFLVGSPTTSSTQFTYPSVPSGQAFSATYRCTVTDSVGQTATADVLVAAQNLGGF